MIICTHCFTIAQKLSSLAKLNHLAQSLKQVLTGLVFVTSQTRIIVEHRYFRLRCHCSGQRIFRRKSLRTDGRKKLDPTNGHIRFPLASTGEFWPLLSTFKPSMRVNALWAVVFYKNVLVFSNTSYLLCISTSKRVLRTPFPGQNQFFDAITTFSVTNGTK